MVKFYFVRTQEKCEIALIDMFNNIVVNKYTDLDRKNYTKTIRVPIVINQDKNFANWYRSVDHKRRPMPIPIGGLRYVNKQENSNNRTQATYARQIFSRATDQWIRDIQPTPYYLFYELEFLMDNKSDFGQITENIVPYFNTFRTLRIKEFDFAPDIERKIPVYLQSVTDTFEDEVEAGPKHRFIKTKFLFRLEVDWYRPFEMPEMIKYAEMNYRIDDFTHVQQIFVYPDPIAQQEKKAWEQLAPSIRTGFTLLKTMAKTLVKQVDLDGNISWEDVTAPDADRPQEVPSFQLLHLNFDDDTPLEDDHSGFDRDFVALNDSTREFVPDLPPGSGQDVEDGYRVADGVEWNKILDWFGTDNGLHESPYTFQSILQFKDDPVPDTIFQYLSNDEVLDSNGGVEIPAGEVFFDWGIIDQRPYYTFKTYGDDALFYTFTTKFQLNLNNTDIYKFVFVSYDKGHAGMFGYTINDGPMIALETERS